MCSELLVIYVADQPEPVRTRLPKHKVAGYYYYDRAMLAAHIDMVLYKQHSKQSVVQTGVNHSMPGWLSLSVVVQSPGDFPRAFGACLARSLPCYTLHTHTQHTVAFAFARMTALH